MQRRTFSREFKLEAVKQVEIDNNIAKNAMRCIAVGRKSYWFARSDDRTWAHHALKCKTACKTFQIPGVNSVQ